MTLQDNPVYLQDVNVQFITKCVLGSVEDNCAKKVTKKTKKQ